MPWPLGSAQQGPGHVEIAVRGVPAPRNPADGNLGE